MIHESESGGARASRAPCLASRRTHLCPKGRRGTPRLATGTVALPGTISRKLAAKSANSRSSAKTLPLPSVTHRYPTRDIRLGKTDAKRPFTAKYAKHADKELERIPHLSGSNPFLQSFVPFVLCGKINSIVATKRVHWATLAETAKILQLPGSGFFQQRNP